MKIIKSDGKIGAAGDSNNHVTWGDDVSPGSPGYISAEDLG